MTNEMKVMRWIFMFMYNREESIYYIYVCILCMYICIYIYTRYELKWSRIGIDFVETTGYNCRSKLSGIFKLIMRLSEHLLYLFLVLYIIISYRSYTSGFISHHYAIRPLSLLFHSGYPRKKKKKKREKTILIY